MVFPPTIGEKTGLLWLLLASCGLSWPLVSSVASFGLLWPSLASCGFFQNHHERRGRRGRMRRKKKNNQKTKKKNNKRTKKKGG